MILTTTRDHRITIVCDTRADSCCEIPARKHTRKLVNICLCIRRNRIALCVALLCAVGVEQVSTDREELLHFARKVLVRTCSCAETHVEILAHRRRECDLVQEGAITAKSISVQ